MSSDKYESLADVWASRYDDRDAEDLVSDRWALRLAMRDQAMAQPFRNFEVPEETASDLDLRSAANDARPESGPV
jgi:hypothetical protein